MAKDKQVYDGSTMLKSVSQEAFTDNMLAGKHQNEAYMLAYQNCKSIEVADAAASRLLRNVKVKARLAYKRTKLEKKTGITIVNLQHDLIEQREAAKAEGDRKSAIRCTELLLKTIGGFQADQVNEKTLQAKQRTDKQLEQLRKAVESVYRQKYLATEGPVTVIDVGLDDKDDSNE